MKSNKFKLKHTKRHYTNEPAFAIICNVFGTLTTYKHDNKEDAWAEHAKRGHSKDTCQRMIKDNAMEKYEMSKKDADFIDSYVNDYHNGNETLEFQ